jgi:hypothetical protein
MTLVEQYKNRLNISESVYSRSHGGAKMDNHRKICTAKCLQNVERFLNEAFENSVGTQRSDMGMFKKFCLNLTTVALPNLIANELVIVSPMSSMSGFITYVQYTAGTNKGQTKQGDVFNDPFKLGNVDVNYTAARVVEEFTGSSATASWFPVYTGADVASRARITSITTADGTAVEVAADATVTVAEDGKTLTLSNGTGTAIGNTDKVKVAYVYDNVVIPQNDLPIVNAEMKSISLIAKARRVAIYYSQIAAYQAKTDYGFDLGDQLAEKAVGQLSYEIDTEITDLLIDHAETQAELVWSKTLPVGVSNAEHYQGFTEIVEIARQKIYDATKRFAPNYMLCASNLLPVLTFINGFSAAPSGQINGPYFAGTLNGLKVFVTPNMEPGHFVIGVNGSDMMSSAAVYAPYMAIVPTQLLQYADGGTSQGWSTLYDLKALNTYVKDGHEYSNLLVQGYITA